MIRTGPLRLGSGLGSNHLLRDRISKIVMVRFGLWLGPRGQAKLQV
jgi:hypothetical protein